MARIPVLVDTDIFIDYFNSGRFSILFDTTRFTIYYSVVTKKELLAKPGLRDAKRQAILQELRTCRLVKLTDAITTRYTELRRLYPSLQKAEALIAASALTRNLPLVTRNRKHFQIVAGLTLFGP